MLVNWLPRSLTPAFPEMNGRSARFCAVVIFVEEDGGDWHARRLQLALERLGATVITTSLKRCAFDTDLPSGIEIPGLDGKLPEGAFVRAISKGSLEEITVRLGLLHALGASGVRVWNEARVIERCVDKSTATFLFQRAGLPVPRTRVAEGRAGAIAYAKGRTPLVLKPLFGSQGNGIRRVDEACEMPAEEDVRGVYYLQRYLRAADADEFSDWRVLVSAGRIIGAMARQGPNWVTNVHQGARPEAVDLDAEARHLALAAVSAVGADYAGVDLIRDDDGHLMVLEINSNPAWKGLQSICKKDIATALAEDFLRAVRMTMSTK